VISLAYAMLWLFVFSLPWGNVLRMDNVTVVNRATGALALAGALFAVVISGRLRRLHQFHIAALAFVAWAGANLLFFYTGAGEKFPLRYWGFVQLFLVLWITWELAPSPQRLAGLLVAYVCGAYVAAFNTILLYRRAASELRRFAAGETDPNDLAMTLALGLPMAWYVATTTHRPLLRWLCRGYLPVGLLAIALTASRGGMVASLVALLIIPLSMTRMSPGRLAAAIVVLCISGAVAVSFVPEKVVQRLATTSSEVEELHFGGRFRIWQAGIKAFEEQPVVGYGTSGFKRAVSKFGVGQVAHNTFLSLLVEQGLIGFLLYGTMLVTVLLAVQNLPQLERRFALVLLATMLTAMLPLTWEDKKVVWVILAVLVGLSQASRAGAILGRRDAPIRRQHPLQRPRPVGPLQPVQANRNPSRHRPA
jgi:O-antigen ligase